MAIKERSLFWMAFLSIITFGIYQIYWTVRTKNEMKSLGADIPTAFLIIVPFAHLYFWYKYAAGFTEHVKKGANVLAYFFVSLIPYFLLFNTDSSKSWIEILFMCGTALELGFLVMLVFQMEFNKYARDGRRNAH